MEAFKRMTAPNFLLLYCSNCNKTGGGVQEGVYYKQTNLKKAVFLKAFNTLFLHRPF